MKILFLSLLAFTLVNCAHNHNRRHHAGGSCDGGCKSGCMMGGKHMKGHWKEMDANSDGKVSKDEFNAAHGKMFSKMDADGDGFVTKEEKMKMKGHMKDGMACEGAMAK